MKMVKERGDGERMIHKLRERERGGGGRRDREKLGGW